MSDQLPDHARGRLQAEAAVPPTQAERNFQDGVALVRVARELREHFADQEVPKSFADDLDTIERVGRWLGTAQVIDGTALGFRVTGLR